MERDGVVEDELRSTSEFVGDCFRGEVPMEGAQDIGENKGNVVGQGFRERGGYSGECIVSTDCDARYGPIGKDENRNYGVDVILDLCRNSPLV